MAISKRSGQLLIGACLILILPALPLFLIMGSNAVGGLLSVILDARPGRLQVAGTYEYRAVWGKAKLMLRSDGTFAEQLVGNNGEPKLLNGTWESRGNDNALDLTLRPFLSVQDEDHGKEYQVGGLPSYKRRLGAVYILINDDVGESFTKSIQ